MKTIAITEATPIHDIPLASLGAFQPDGSVALTVEVDFDKVLSGRMPLVRIMGDAPQAFQEWLSVTALMVNGHKRRTLLATKMHDRERVERAGALDWWQDGARIRFQLSVKGRAIVCRQSLLKADGTAEKKQTLKLTATTDEPPTRFVAGLDRGRDCKHGPCAWMPPFGTTFRVWPGLSDKPPATTPEPDRVPDPIDEPEEIPPATPEIDFEELGRRVWALVEEMRREAEEED